MHQLDRLAEFVPSVLRWSAPWVCALVVSTTLAFAMNAGMGGRVSDASQTNLAPAPGRGTKLSPAEARIFETAITGLGDSTAQEETIDQSH
jgi:hypothetical protein